MDHHSILFKIFCRLTYLSINFDSKLFFDSKSIVFCDVQCDVRQANCTQMVCKPHYMIMTKCKKKKKLLFNHKSQNTKRIYDIE